MTDWDFDHQRNETAVTLHQILQETDLAPTTRVTLDLHFAPGAAADAAACLKALTTFGYRAGMQDDGTLTAQIDDVPLEVEVIWLHEERTTRIALARGFTPESWGFFEP